MFPVVCRRMYVQEILGHIISKFYFHVFFFETVPVPLESFHFNSSPIQPSQNLKQSFNEIIH